MEDMKKLTPPTDVVVEFLNDLLGKCEKGEMPRHGNGVAMANGNLIVVSVSGTIVNANGDHSVAVAGTGNNINVGNEAVLLERIAMLEKIIEEKERLINVLMKGQMA